MRCSSYRQTLISPNCQKLSQQQQRCTNIQTLQAILIGASILVSLGVLFYSSWSDYKTREVSNRVWVIYAPIALGLTLAELFLFEPSKLLFFGISVGVTVGLALLLFYAGGFGGADSKALMCIALALPFAPLALITPFASGFADFANYISNNYLRQRCPVRSSKRHVHDTAQCYLAPKNQNQNVSWSPRI